MTVKMLRQDVAATLVSYTDKNEAKRAFRMATKGSLDQRGEMLVITPGYSDNDPLKQTGYVAIAWRGEWPLKVTVMTARKIISKRLGVSEDWLCSQLWGWKTRK